MIKSQPYHMTVQGSFRHVRVLIATVVVVEFPFVGMLGDPETRLWSADSPQDCPAAAVVPVLDGQPRGL
jgi:hypothetical protein